MDKVIVNNPKGGSSHVWKYFGFYKINNIISKDKAVCKICNLEYKYTGGTTNLNQHLQKHHTDLSQTVLPSTSGLKGKIQTPITSMLKIPAQQVAFGSAKHTEMTQSIAEYTVGDLVPISNVDSIHFKGMVSRLSGGMYQPPNRKYFTKTYFPKIYSEASSNIHGELQGIYGVGITTDAWTSLATESYITYTAHYITKEWEMRSKVLSTNATTERHTSENLAHQNVLLEQKWGLDKLLFSPVYVHDNASNVCKATKIMPNARIGIPCLSHTINLASNTATDIPEVKAVIKKGRGVVGTFRQSTIANNTLKQKQELLLPEKQHKLFQDCPTCWNSSYDMLERLSEQTQTITAAALDPQLKHLNIHEDLFTAKEQNDIVEILSVLKPMKMATVFLSGENQPTASRALPTLAKLKQEMLEKPTDTPLGAKMKNAILQSLSGRYVDEQIKTFLLAASYLDPRYKTVNFASALEKERAKQHVKDMCLQVARNKLCSANIKQEKEEALPQMPQIEESVAPAKKPKLEEAFQLNIW